ncbi:MAG: ribulose-phosphate 3-epimerase, partial [Oscillospiraceae bacterium]|nr:ribulose-phosphate 3-epimerase [Oscillospiraceae bacterium]
CDFARLDKAVEKVERGGADMLHLDVMDGVFVPNLTFGPPVIACLRPLTALPFDVHLMMQYPDKLIQAFCDAGADSVNIHVECASPLLPALSAIRAGGKRAALTVKPGTPAAAVFPYLEWVDMVLVMTVEPGFGGQGFMADILPKIALLKEEIDRRSLAVSIQVDGGITADTAPQAAAAGADNAVVGSAFFNAPDPAALVKLLHKM